MAGFVVNLPGKDPFGVELHDRATIGRDGDCDVVLLDVKVSRTHARVERVGGAWSLRDLGSTHGTFVNGARVTEVELTTGDQLQLGQTILRFVAEDVDPDVLCALDTVETPPAYIGDHLQDDPLAAQSAALERAIFEQVLALTSGEASEAAKFLGVARPRMASLMRDFVRRADQRLRLVYDVARALGSLDEQDGVLGRMLEGVVQVLGAERGLIGICEPGSIRTIQRFRRGAEPSEIAVSRAVLGPVLQKRRSLIVQEPTQHATLMRERVLSAMAAPLLLGGKVFGYLYVDDRSAPGRFAEPDLEYLAALAHLTAALLVSAERLRRAAAGVGADGEDAVMAIVGESLPMQMLRSDIRKFAAADSHVLVRGESGTGKELVARALHALSPRASRPLVTLNCAALPETMVESELFGYEKGSFTGAIRDKRGKFVQAHGGTLFLDEIGDLALPAQAKLLRAIQEGEVQPLGSERTVRVDVRVVAATHKDLSAEIAAGRFRRDLYYRLAVVELTLPPLRERGGDVVLLTQAMLTRVASKACKPLVGFSPEALDAILRYEWPGNVRELQNEVERATILAQGSVIELDELSRKLQPTASPRPIPMPQCGAQLQDASLAAQFATLEVTERALVEQALTLARGNVSEAARILGISWIMMKRRIDRFCLRANTGHTG
jgi:Nif-specific regulatory protein